MEEARWDGVLRNASKVAQNYDFEKKIRYASTNKELLCPDPNCPEPLVRYCNGDKKEPYFAHLKSSDCVYDRFDRTTGKEIKNVCNLIYEKLSQEQRNVLKYTRIADDQIAHILIDNHYVIEFITKKIGAAKLSEITEIFKSNNLQVQYVVIDDNVDIDSEDSVSWAKRFVLNEGYENTLLIIDADGQQVMQYHYDKEDYLYQGNKFTYCSDNEINGIFSSLGIIDDLEFDDNKKMLSLNSFIQDLKAEKTRKNATFDKWKEKIDENNRLAQERALARAEEIRQAEIKRQEAERQKQQRKKQEELEREAAKKAEQDKKEQERLARIAKNQGEIAEYLQKNPKVKELFEYFQYNTVQSGVALCRQSNGKVVNRKFSFENMKTTIDIKKECIMLDEGIANSVYVFWNNNPLHKNIKWNSYRYIEIPEQADNFITEYMKMG